MNEVRVLGDKECFSIFQARVECAEAPGPRSVNIYEPPKYRLQGARSLAAPMRRFALSFAVLADFTVVGFGAAAVVSPWSPAAPGTVALPPARVRQISTIY